MQLRPAYLVSIVGEVCDKGEPSIGLAVVEVAVAVECVVSSPVILCLIPL